MKRILILAILLAGMAAAQTTLGPTNIVLLGIGTYPGATLQSRFPASNWQWYVAWVTDGPSCGGGGTGPAVLCYSNGTIWTPLSTGGGGGGGGGLQSINNSTIPNQTMTGANGITVSTVVGSGITTISLPAPTLSTLSLNPASVIGGASSTGTATLTAAAPTGGAIVNLSSSNTSVATVPLNVTVAAGATTATFVVSTLAQSSSTSATITGVYGATKTATLTVTIPQPIYGGPGQPGATSSVTLVGGNTVRLSTGDILNQLQNTAEQVGQSWSFSPSNQVVYLLLFGSSHTFTDANTGFLLPFNAPISVTLNGVQMYLYQTTNALSTPVKPRIAS